MEYVFLEGNSALPQDAREDLVVTTFDMYLDNNKSKKVKGDCYEGRITTDGTRFVLGAFGGQRFFLKLDTDFGKMNLECLVTQKVNAFS